AKLLGTDAFQETDVVGFSMPGTKWNIQVRRVEDIAPSLAKAFHIARSGRPGPVLVDITKNAQTALGEFNYVPCLNIRSYKPYPKVEPEAISKAADLINNAKSPFVLYGQGVLIGKAEAELAAFLKKTGIPAASTLLGTGALPESHPQYAGKLGMHGNYAPNLLTNKSDVLIAIGMRFDDRVTGDLSRYAKHAKVIHLELDPGEINKNVKCEVAILGDCKVSLEMLIQEVKENSHPEWMDKFRELYAEEKSAVVSND